MYPNAHHNTITIDFQQLNARKSAEALRREPESSLRKKPDLYRPSA